MGSLGAGSIDAHVDREKIYRGESVILTISIVGDDIQSLPDIPTIGEAKVIYSNRKGGTNLIYLNGKAKMQLLESLILEFRPKKDMVIPSFQIEVDGEIKSTKSIEIKVSQEKKKSIISSDNFSLDMKLSKTKMFLGEPIVATVKFRQKKSINVLKIEYKMPEFNGFFSKMVGKQKNYNEGKYTCMELQYLLVAKQEGRFPLHPAKARVSRSSNNKKQGDYFSDIPIWTKLTSLSPIVEIIKPMGRFDIVGDYTLSDKIDNQEVKVNKPVNLRIELTGEGSLEDYEGVVFDIAGVTVYGDDPKIESQLHGGKVESHFVQNFVFIAERDFVIPSQRIHVYNYKSKKMNLLQTKAYNIKVLGSSLAPLESKVYTQQRVEDKKETRQQIATEIKEKMPFWLVLLSAFLLGVLATVITKRLLPSLAKLKIRSFGLSIDESLRVLYPKISESVEVEEMVRKLYAKKQGKKVAIDKKLLKRLIERYRENL
jgi:hypothetical protein